MAELTLGSLNLHMGRGTGGHAAPFYDVVTACKEIDTDVLVLQEAWVPDDDEGDVLAVAAALGYRVAGTFAVARATCHDQVRLVARRGPEGDGDWAVAVLSRLPVVGPRSCRSAPSCAGTRAGGRSCGRWSTRAARSFTVVGTHMPLLKDPVWRLAPAMRARCPHPASRERSPAT